MRLALLIAGLIYSGLALCGPVLGIAVVAGVGGGIAAGAGGFFAAFVVNFALTVILLSAAQALVKKPSFNNRGLGPGRNSSTVTAPAANAPRQMILGRTRVGGVVTYLEVTGNRQFLHMLITVSGHEIDSFNNFLFDDKEIILDPAGDAQGDYLVIDTDNFVHHALIPATPPYEITIPHAATLILGVYAAPSPIGQPPPTFNFLDASPNPPASQGQFLRSASLFTFHQSDAGRDMRISYEAQTATHSFARLQTRTGGPLDTPLIELVLASGAKWSILHWQHGCAKLYVRLTSNVTQSTPVRTGRVDAFLSGVPNITVVANGAKAFDPRTGLTVWTTNSALLLVWYLTLPKVEGGCGVDYATGISEAHLIAAANVCDEVIAVAGPVGSTTRYQCNGSFNTDSSPDEIIDFIKGTMAGELVRLGGLWRIYAGAYIAPTVTLDESECRGNMKIQTLASRRDSFNRVKGTYTNPAKNWQSDDFPPVKNALYLSEDGGEEIYDDVDFPFTNTAVHAQRLAKIMLERSRQQIVVDYPGQLSVLRVQPPEIVGLTNLRMGWVNKPFQVVRGTFSVYDDETGSPAIGYDLQLRETASTVYDWSAGDETEIDPAPDTNLPSPFDIPIPSVPNITEELYETSGSAGVRSRVVVAISIDDPSAASAFQFEYKSAGIPQWTTLPPVRIAQITINDLIAGFYDFRALTIGYFGQQGVYGPIATKQILGLTAPPSDITGFSATNISGQMMIHIDPHPDLDVIIGGRIILRWSPLLVGATWNQGSLLAASGWPGDSVTFVAPLPGSGTIMAKARDTTGHYSNNAAFFVVTEAILTGFTTDFTLTEHAAFAGAKSNVAAVDAGVQLVGATLIDDMGLIDDQDRIDSLGGIVPAGSYGFATLGDLGVVKTVRIFPHIKSFAFDTDDLWDSRTDLIDSWGLVDGDVIEDADTQLFVRVTDDDPTAAPSWGPWHILDGQVDYTTRGFEFRLDFSSANVTHNRSVTELSVAAKTPI